MPITLRRGTVTAIRRAPDVGSRGSRSTARRASPTRRDRPIAVGDDVLVNVQARELALGSGGFDVLHANLTRGLELPAEAGAHVMKLPYTPIQFAVRHGEEDGTFRRPLDGMPVVCCSLHSQVAPVCAALQGLLASPTSSSPGVPSSRFRLIRSLRAQGARRRGHRSGACLTAIWTPSTSCPLLVWLRGDSDVVVASIGPGIVGTGSRSDTAAWPPPRLRTPRRPSAARAVLALGISEGGPRERHRGVSHHTRAVVELTLGDLVVAWPGRTRRLTGCRRARKWTPAPGGRRAELPL